MDVAFVGVDRDLGESLVAMLTPRRCAIAWCRREAVPLLSFLGVDVVLLDLDSSNSEGLRLLTHLRRISTAPVLVLVNSGDEERERELLTAGAAEVLVKPIVPAEALARIEELAQLRSGIVRIAARSDVTIDLDTHEVQVDSHPVLLTPKEFELLALLARNVGQPVSRRRILERVWGAGYRSTATRSLDVHMTTLRNKLGCPTLIETVRGFGYRLVDTGNNPSTRSAIAASPKLNKGYPASSVHHHQESDHQFTVSAARCQGAVTTLGATFV